MGNDLGRDRVMYMHLTLMPYLPAAGELKTKPTQHSVKELLGLGIQPDVLLCRADRPIPDSDRKKIALFCNVRERSGDPGPRRRDDLRGADQLSRAGPRRGGLPPLRPAGAGTRSQPLAGDRRAGRRGRKAR